MKLPELHPDELLWREACGTLTPNERADLWAHLQRCPACALERAVRGEAARARVPSEADHAIAARLVERVLATADRQPLPPVRVGWRRPLAVAAAAILLVAGTAIAATALVVRAREQRRASGALAPTSSRYASSRVAAEPQRSETAAPEAPSERDLLAAATDEKQPRTASENGGAARHRHSSSYRAAAATRNRLLAYRAPEHRAGSERAAGVLSPAQIVAPSPAPSPSPVSSSSRFAVPRGGGSAPTAVTTPSGSSAEPAAAVSPVTAESLGPAPGVEPAAPNEAPALLRRAEQARTSRRWLESSHAFRELGRRYPGSREEIVARALYGQLLLDQLGEPARALTMFDRYLAAEPSGTLAEEARLGRAEALRRLARPADERSAWLELLREHPASVHAAAARARLAALDRP